MAKRFRGKDQPGYKLGYFATVAEAFKPHFDQINIGGSHNVMAPSASSSVFFTPGSEQSQNESNIKKAIALETWEATMDLIAGGQTKDAIRRRAVIGCSITGSRSKTEFERQSLPVIERQVEILLALEERMKLDQPADERALTNCIAMAVKDVENPAHKNITLLEAMLQGSRSRCQKGPQPVVATIDQGKGRVRLRGGRSKPAGHRRSAREARIRGDHELLHDLQQFTHDSRHHRPAGTQVFFRCHWVGIREGRH